MGKFAACSVHPPFPMPAWHGPQLNCDPLDDGEVMLHAPRPMCVGSSMVGIEDEHVHLKNQSSTFFHPVRVVGASTVSTGDPASTQALYHKALNREQAATIRRST